MSVLSYGGPMKWLLISVLFVVCSVDAYANTWMETLKDSKFEGELEDCLNGSATAQTTCVAILEFNGVDSLGRLTGRLEISLKGQSYELLLEHLPQSDEPYRLQIKNAYYTRRLKAAEADELNFRGPAGDTEPTAIRLYVDPIRPSQELGLFFNQRFPFKKIMYMASGMLVKK